MKSFASEMRKGDHILLLGAERLLITNPDYPPYVVGERQDDL